MKNIILDTDIGPDCDDAGAIALLNIFKNRGLCNILGIGHCTSNPYGAGAIDVICRHYGNYDIKIGTTYREGFLCSENNMSYNRALCERFANRYKKEKPEEAVSLYRRLLANAEDGSVTFVAIGPLNNLSELLNSAPDEASPLFGKELVKEKVKKLVLMAGIFPATGECAKLLLSHTHKSPEEYAEFNVVCDTAASKNVSENWQTPKICLGFEAGLFKTGFKDDADFENPVALAYRLYSGCCEKNEAMRHSWDLFTVYYAVNGETDLFTLSDSGTVKFSENGLTEWREHKDGLDAYLIHAKPSEVIVNTVNKLLNM